MQAAQQPQPGLTVMPPPSAKLAEQAAQAAQTAPVVGTPNVMQLPRTKAEYEALLERKSALSDQLNSAAGRRNQLARQLQSASDGVSRSGLEDRLKVLDARLVQLEKDIATNSSLLAQAPPSLISSTQPAGNLGMNPEVVVPISVVFTLFVLAPIAITFARNMWRRGSRPAAPVTSSQTDARLERVEQSVDAIAIEIERITEGQRFITQLLSKTQSAPALGVGQGPAEPIRVANADAVPVAKEPLRR